MSSAIEVLAALVQPDQMHKAVKRMRSFEQTTPIKLAGGGQVYECSTPGNFIALRIHTPEAAIAATGYIPPPFMYRLRIQLTASGAREETLEFVLLGGETLKLPFDDFRAELIQPGWEWESKFAGVGGSGTTDDKLIQPYLLHGWTLGDVHIPSGGAPAPVQEIGVAGWHTLVTPFAGIAPNVITPWPVAVGFPTMGVIDHCRVTNLAASPGGITVDDGATGAVLEGIAAGASVQLNYPMQVGDYTVTTAAAAGAYDFLLHYGVRL